MLFLQICKRGVLFLWAYELFRLRLKIKEGVAELPTKKLSKSLNFHKLRLFYVHKIL